MGRAWVGASSPALYALGAFGLVVAARDRARRPVVGWLVVVLVVRGVADALADAHGEPWPGARCGLDPLRETRADASTDGWVTLSGPVVIALYRVRTC